MPSGSELGNGTGRSFIHLAQDDRKRFAELQLVDRSLRPEQVCLPRSSSGSIVSCTEEGGICSIRMYGKAAARNEVFVVPGRRGNLRTTCPYRFQQNGLIFRWIGETIFGHPEPLIAREIGFLERPSDEATASEAGSGTEEVGRIDNVLVHPSREPMHWCALEIQAVYFSGSSMGSEFKLLRSLDTDAMPFPAAKPAT